VARFGCAIGSETADAWCRGFQVPPEGGAHMRPSPPPDRQNTVYRPGAVCRGDDRQRKEIAPIAIRGPPGPRMHVVLERRSNFLPLLQHGGRAG
jgi:hypothetical protein